MQSSDNINNTWFDEFNSVFTGVLSLIFNIALILVTSKVKIYSDYVKRMQIFGAVLRLIFSVLIVFSSPVSQQNIYHSIISSILQTLAYITDAEAVYIVKGGFSLPIKLGE